MTSNDTSKADEPITDMEIDHVHGTTKTIEYTGERPPTAVDEMDHISAADAVDKIVPIELPAVEIVNAWKYNGGGTHLRFKLGTSEESGPTDPRTTFVIDTRRAQRPELDDLNEEIEFLSENEGKEGEAGG